MTKKEKYIRFIVNDLVKTTTIIKRFHPTKPESNDFDIYLVSNDLLWNGGRVYTEIKESIGSWGFKNLESKYGITKEDFHELVYNYKGMVERKVKELTIIYNG